MQVNAHGESPADPTYRIARKYYWIVPAVGLSVALITVQYWLPDPFSEQRAAQLRTVDAEHDLLCQRFGFPASSEQFLRCKGDLRKLWDFHKDMEVSY
jgi:hypothetical protein